MAHRDTDHSKDPESRSIGALALYALAILASVYLMVYWTDEAEPMRFVMYAAALAGSVVMFVLELRRPPPGKSA